MRMAARRPWSCDTFAGRPNTETPTIFGKNSDRPARECQPLNRVSARPAGTTQHLAYVDIDDTAETIAHLGSSPYWCWGHEMGLNAAGVAVGNEAIFTRDLATNVMRAQAGEDLRPGILGMELVRLALERATTAHDAVAVMAELVERHGQWGAGTRTASRASAAYDNAYLIADRHQVWVVETSGTRWAARQVIEPSWSLSNEPTIRNDWDECADDLRRHADANGWTVGSDKVDFAATFLDPKVPLQVSHIRLQRSRQLLDDTLKAEGRVGFDDARRVLSDHYEDTFLAGPLFNPARPDFLTLCMHEHPAEFTWGNTAASMVAVLPKNGTPFLWWAAATPCTSVYVPVSATAHGLPSVLGKAGARHGVGPNPEGVSADTYSDDSYWWSFQRLLETVAGDELGSAYLERQPVVRQRFDALQQRWSADVDRLGLNASEAEWEELTESSTKQALAAARDSLSGFTAANDSSTDRQWGDLEC
jgi:secernin